MTTGSLSLFELRRHLVRQSAALTVRAQRLGVQGAASAAAELVRKSRQLRTVARTMGRNDFSQRRRS